MTAEQFAALIEAIIAEANDRGMPIEEQIEVLERIAKAMRDALGSP
jgi:hypothetical protein